MKRSIVIVAALVLPAVLVLGRFLSADQLPASSAASPSGPPAALASHPTPPPRLSFPPARAELPAPSAVGAGRGPSLAAIDTMVAEIDQQLRDETDAATRAKLLAYAEALGQMRHELE